MLLPPTHHLAISAARLRPRERSLMVFAFLHAHRKARRVVVAQVFTDAGQRVTHVDPERLEQRGRADAGQLQQLRRIERAAREDDLAARAHLDR